MFCADCRTMNDDASRFCIKCGAKAGSATMLRSPIEEARQMIQVSALLCYLIAALHIYELLVAAGGTLRSAAAIGAAACAVLAWMLWSSTGTSISVPVPANLGLTVYRDWQNNLSSLQPELTVTQMPVLLESSDL